MLSDKDVKEFQEIYKQEFGKEISEQEAMKPGSALIRLAEFSYKQYINSMNKREKQKKPKGNNAIIESKSNSDNPRIGREFEQLVRLALKAKFKMEFRSKVVLVGNPPKAHTFDLVSEDGNIIVECKNYAWTKSGYVPSAKCATLNEAVLYLLKAPKEAKKIIVLRRSCIQKKKESFAEYYYRRYTHLLEDINIMELDTNNMVLKNINGDI